MFQNVLKNVGDNLKKKNCLTEMYPLFGAISAMVGLKFSLDLNELRVMFINSKTYDYVVFCEA